MKSFRLAAALGCAALIVPAVVTAARPPVTEADPAQMVLATTDFAAAKVTKQGYEKPERKFPYAYTREFEDVVFRGRRLPALSHTAGIAATAATAKAAYAQVAAGFASPAGREALKKELERILAEVKGAKVVVAAPRTLRVGDESFAVTVTITAPPLTLAFVLAAYRVDRVLATLSVLLLAKPELQTPRLLAQAAVVRTKRALAPANLTPPSITGVAQEGQTLAATRATWRGKPSFTYQWLRCDAAGGNCAPIAGATGSTYTPTAADAGSTLRVAVTGRNAFGSATARSPQTAVVTPAVAPPVNTVPPAIAGTAQVGQTLTASPGTWTGAPTSFAYQWQRCDAAGANCVDIPGATAATYVVTAADVGFTLRVRVTASNAAGSAAATSPPTPVVIA